MDKRPNWQTLILSILWLSSCIAFCFAFYLQHHRHKSEQQNILSELLPVSTASEPKEYSKYIPGLFGEAKKSTQVKPTPNKKKSVVNFGPKSLQGVFIHNDKAYALVTDYSRNHHVVTPDQIAAYSLNSVTIQTSQGIKSLHIQHDRNGVDIRRISKRRKDNNGVVKEEISEADRIRLMLLQGSK